MAKCGICCQQSTFTMNSKHVCLRCDDLLFDLELELEEIEVQDRTGKDSTKGKGSQPSLPTSKAS